MSHSAYRLQLLAPAGKARCLGPSQHVQVDAHYYHFLHSSQLLRGRCYLQDGAIERRQLDEEGRFALEDDLGSWHLLLVDAHDQVIGCARFLVHLPSVRFEQLRLEQIPLAQDPLWRPLLRQAIEQDRERAQAEHCAYVELGGWAVDANWRTTRAALDILLGAYAWGQLLGGCLCFCTATVRHRSATILQRLGAHPFVVTGRTIPAYDDPHYGCQMELLRFDSRHIAPRFVEAVKDLSTQLQQIPVLESPSFSSEADSFRWQTDFVKLGRALTMPSGVSSESDSLPYSTSLPRVEQHVAGINRGI